MFIVTALFKFLYRFRFPVAELSFKAPNHRCIALSYFEALIASIHEELDLSSGSGCKNELREYVVHRFVAHCKDIDWLPYSTRE